MNIKPGELLSCKLLIKLAPTAEHLFQCLGLWGRWLLTGRPPRLCRRSPPIMSSAGNVGRRGGEAPQRAASTFINLDRRAFCCIITERMVGGGVRCAEAEIRYRPVRFVGGSRGLPSGGPQSESCWRGRCARKSHHQQKFYQIKILLHSSLTQERSLLLELRSDILLSGSSFCKYLSYISCCVVPFLLFFF